MITLKEIHEINLSNILDSYDYTETGLQKLLEAMVDSGRITDVEGQRLADIVTIMVEEAPPNQQEIENAEDAARREVFEIVDELFEITPNYREPARAYHKRLMAEWLKVKP